MTINLKVPDIRELKPRITVFGVGDGGGAKAIKTYPAGALTEGAGITVTVGTGGSGASDGAGGQMEGTLVVTAVSMLNGPKDLK